MDSLTNDEDSFVVLGTSPGTSLNSYNSSAQETELNKNAPEVMEMSSQTDKTLSSFQSQLDIDHFQAPQTQTQNIVPDKMRSTELMIESQQAIADYSILQHEIVNMIDSPKQGNSMGSVGAGKNDSQENAPKTNISTSVSALPDVKEFQVTYPMSSSSFSDIKPNVFDAFPSLKNSNTKDQDIDKLQALIYDHLNLKENLQKTNFAMRQHFSTINKWFTTVKLRRDEQSLQINDHMDTINKLNNEILQLKKDIEDRDQKIATSQDKFNEEKYQLELEVEKQKLLIIDFNEQIEKLNQNSFDIINNSTIDGNKVDSNTVEQKPIVSEIGQIDNANKTSLENTNSLGENQLDLVGPKVDEQKQTEITEPAISTQTFEEYAILTKQLKGQLSKLLAENLEIQDMKKIYINEIDCLKVNLTAAEELLNQTNKQLRLMEAKNVDLENLLKEKNFNIITLNDDAKNSKENDTHQIVSLMRLIDDLTEQNDLLSKQKTIYNNEVKELNSKYSSMVEQHRELTVKAEELKLKNNELINLLEKQDAEMTELKEEVKLVMNLETTQTECLQNKLAEANVKILEMENTIENDKSTIASLKEKEESVSELKEKVHLLTQQLDLYKADFETEKQARLDMANEREEILSDLKLLQRRNQQLMDEKEKWAKMFPTSSSGSRSSSSSSSSSPPSPPGDGDFCVISKGAGKPKQNLYKCPICGSIFNDVFNLERHVQLCLDS